MTTLTHWDRQTRHIDRALKPTELRGLKGSLLKAKVKENRGLPSRSLPSSWVFAWMRLKLRLRTSNPPTPAEFAKLEREKRHDRLMERKRRERAAAKRKARPSARDTNIFLWKRRQEWLRHAESPTAACEDRETN